MKTTLTILNSSGLHAKASAKLTQLAAQYPCELWLSKGERRVNAKSIMGVMMLAAGQGVSLELEANGDQASEALSAIAALVAAKFDEE